MNQGIYVETSSLLSILLKEPNFEKLASFLETNDSIVKLTSIITLIETRRILARLFTLKSFTEVELNKLLGTLQQIENSWFIYTLTDSIVSRSGNSFPIEPVRTLDAIHLATALEFQKAFNKITVCSNDKRIIDNLKPLGFEIF